MVDIFLTPEEYDIIEKWFGLLFGGKSSKKPSKEEVSLYQKLAFMHIAEMQAEIAEAEDDS
ncbi:MAG: hypothetical protein CL489_11700 [Acidobacteria bacterium]|nr:hypothetical protein [Acidobacteriota bacterium]|tara:strand:- start:182 stop:364 length:183 start_codon:yes stop_codon:yes gene_type:complete